MIIMALDHTRDFFHAGAMSFSPTDLTQTTPILFFTRWITHFCLPVFMFAAGTGIFLFGQKHTRSELSGFLLKRGLWFVFLELTVMQFAYNFSFSARFMILLLVLWIFGICMVAMAALIHLPMRWLAAFSLAVIVLQNTLAKFGDRPGVIVLLGKQVLISYTFVPWIAVMAAGFCFGQVFLLEPAARRRMMLRIGLALTVGFVVIRMVNIYGDPAPWTHQKSAVFAVLSFLNCTKYPASLDFLLMTLGPALLVLSYFERRRFSPANPLIVFGRVPLFYFVLHFYVIHALAVLAAIFRYGISATAKFMFNPFPPMGGAAQLFPTHFGYSLWVVYAMWCLTVLLLYPACRWFAGVKESRRDWWLSYL